MADHAHAIGTTGERRDLSEQGGRGRAKKPLTPVLRIIEIAYVAYAVICLAGFMATSRDDMVYGVDTIWAFASCSLSCIALWLIAKRLKAARGYLIFVNFVDVGFSLANLLTGNWGIGAMAGEFAIAVPLIIYLFVSKHVKEVLCEDISEEDRHDASMPKITEFAFWRNLAIYYCVFSVVGHWMEAGFCWLVSIGVVQGSVDFANTELFRDWLYPFAIEGIGFSMCVLLLYPLKELYARKIKVPLVPLLLSLVTNAFVCSLIEFVMGLILNADYGLWDYRDLPFNFMGQICLQNAIGFGIVSTIIVWIIYPFIERFLDRLPRVTVNVAAGIIVAFYAVLQSLYIINLPG